jgi:hypothetical protein
LDILGHAAESVLVQSYAPVAWRERLEAIDKLSY